LGNTEKAIYFYERALEDAPNSPGIHFKLAEMQARQGRFKEAQSYAGKAADLEPGNPYYIRLLAALYSQNNEHDESIKLLQKALKANPEDVEYYELLVGEYLKINKPDDALKMLDRAERQMGPDPELARQRQQIYLKQNRLDEALKEAKKLVQSNPEEPEYLLNLAELYISNNKVAEATKLLSDYRPQLEGLPMYSLLQLQISLKNGDEKEARRYLLTALASPEMELEEKITYLAPYLRAKAEDDKDIVLMLDALQSAHRDQARVYFLRGDFEAGRSKFSDARLAYLRGLYLDKNNFLVWEQVARLDLELQQSDSLAIHTDKALELFPNAAVLWFYNGWAHFLLKDNPKAIRSLERARKLKPTDTGMEKEVYALLGDLYNTQKEFAKSDEAYGQALKLDSLDIHVLNNYSYYLSLREQKLDLAAQLGAKLMAIAPNEGTYQDTYGWVLFKKGDFAQALQFLEKASKPDASGVIFEHYGDALFKNGKTQQAIEAWKTAQQKGGDVSPKLPEKINQGKYIE
jgi:tetratricopeptide (TPR) repeat protein